jgi:hypothetical protein
MIQRDLDGDAGSGFSSQGNPPSSSSLAAISKAPDSGVTGCSTTGVRVGGGSGVGVPGMNSLQARVAINKADRTRMSFLIFTGFSSEL